MDLSPTFDAWHFSCPWVTYLMTYASLIKFAGWTWCQTNYQPNHIFMSCAPISQMSESFKLEVDNAFIFLRRNLAMQNNALNSYICLMGNLCLNAKTSFWVKACQSYFAKCHKSITQPWKIKIELIRKFRIFISHVLSAHLMVLENE